MLFTQGNKNNMQSKFSFQIMNVVGVSNRAIYYIIKEL